MNPKTFRNAIAAQCGMTNKADEFYKATQVCNAGDWPEDFGGNWTPDRIAANHSFSDWLDQQGDSIVPSSFSEWLGSEDSIFIE